MLTLRLAAPAVAPLAGILAALTASTAATAADDVVNVYSSRHYDTDLALYEQFTERTGIEVNLIEAGADALLERLQAEGANSPADMLVTVDAGRLWRAAQSGLLAPVESDVLETRIPAKYQHPENLWFGLSTRARVVVYNAEKGLPEGLKDYEDLADPAYAGMICIRSSSNIYNISLMAELVEVLGQDAAQGWAEGVVANFARDPEGNDTAQIKAVAAGQCDLALANTYYVGRLLGSENPDDRAVGEAVGILFPNQDNRGAHVNISGAGVLANAPNRDNAIAFLEYLASDEAQRLFANGNNEYPVVAAVEPTGPIKAFTDFKASAVNANVYGANARAATEVFDRAGWR